MLSPSIMIITYHNIVTGSTLKCQSFIKFFVKKITMMFSETIVKTSWLKGLFYLLVKSKDFLNTSIFR